MSGKKETANPQTSAKNLRAAALSVKGDGISAEKAPKSIDLTNKVII